MSQTPLAHFIPRAHSRQVRTSEALPAPGVRIPRVAGAASALPAGDRDDDEHDERHASPVSSIARHAPPRKRHARSAVSAAM